MDMTFGQCVSSLRRERHSAALAKLLLHMILYFICVSNIETFLHSCLTLSSGAGAAVLALGCVEVVADG